MGGILSRGVVTLGVLGLIVVGCTDGGSELLPGEPGTTQQAIFSSNPEHHTGADLPDKTLVLTFDDGPAGENNGAQTRAISSYLKTKGIKAVFFAVGACIKATNLSTAGCSGPGGEVDTTLRQLFADGHLLANHTTTHRDMTTVGTNAAMTDLAETDTDLATYASLIPWNHWFFRAPQGNWSATLSTAADANATLRKYIGPIYWNAGGDTTGGRAADWDCFSRGLSTKTCGDRYLTEIRSQRKGIVLMHDQNQYPSPNLTTPANPTDADYNARGNTYLLVRYVVDALEKDGGWQYTTLDEVPSIKAVMPTCNASCGTCKGPAANDCLSCAGGKFLSSGTCETCGTCAAGTYQSAACTATADTTCASCSTCPSGKHVATACSATADTVCADDPPPGLPDAGEEPPDAGTPPGSDPRPGTGAGTGTGTGPGTGTGAGAADGGSATGAAPADAAESGCAASPRRAPSPFGALAVVGLGLLASARRRRRLS